ncbi:GlcG/HbpS family heme-binding protein [Pseudomonas juntendi]|uniref:Heme-binding protein n=1 Tax=Pseudomonas juntendi TaxID=2666183 RepID=A0A7W2PRJ1_9PSED|nr:heme-binding protein [Pseudomonas juntendi]MBA6058188.1 heme-binding protein [Pseudomonas juntendi]MBA6126783.1 heme-binding protein [Pseudomonas juntendi]
MALWLRHQPTITLDLAIEGMKAAVERAKQLDVKVSLVIVDAGGMTIQMSHMDGAPRQSQAIALNKAMTAAGFGRPTSEWTDRLQGCSPAVQAGLPLQPGMALFGGGEPFVIGQAVVGAIGVSGASETNDGLCASAAAARITDLVLADTP